MTQQGQWIGGGADATLPAQHLFFINETAYIQAHIHKDDPGKLSFLGLGLSTLCLIIPIALSLRLSLGLHAQLAVSAIRMILQLTFLGFILVPLFSYSRWWMVLLYAAFMTCVAALEAGQRPAHRYQGQYLHTLVALGMGAWSLIVYAALVVLQLRPLWEAQYIIPVLGMLLGNATSGVSVGLNTALQDLASSKEQIELLLALGANRAEATKEVVKKALTTAMMPTINMMAVMGLVSIPGIMTGQILAGASPSDAGRYQMMIVFLISGSTGIAAMAAVHMAVWHIIDEGAHYRPDRILARRNLSETLRIGARRFITALGRTKDLCLTCLCCVTPSSMGSRWQKRPSPLSRYDEMMYELGDEDEDEEEGVRGDAATHHALMPHRTPPASAPGGRYQQGVSGWSSGVCPADGGHGAVAPRGADGAAWDESPPMGLPGAGLGGPLHRPNGGVEAARVVGGPGVLQDGTRYGVALSPDKQQPGAQSVSMQASPRSHLVPPPTVSLDTPDPPRVPRRLFNAASALGLRLAHAAYGRLGPGSSARHAAGGGGGQYVPLSGSGHGGIGPQGVDLEQGSQGFHGRQAGVEVGPQMATGIGQDEDVMASPEGSARGASGGSTPHDDEQFGSPEFFDAQSISGSSFSSATGFLNSRRASFSSLQGFRGSSATPPRT